MVTITVPDISPETYEALKGIASENGRTIEDEVIAILEYELRDMDAEGLGSALSALGKRSNLEQEEITPNSEHTGRVAFE